MSDYISYLSAIFGQPLSIGAEAGAA